VKTTKPISEVVRQAAIDSNLTQVKLAAMAKTSQRAISIFLRGGAIHIDAIDRLGKRLGIVAERRR
jgi:plasmid maintenance system antidote protein VapI